MTGSPLPEWLAAAINYDPRAPFNAGSPATTTAEMIAVQRAPAG